MEFTSAGIRKALDYIDSQGAKKFYLRPSTALGLVSCLNFEFTSQGKATSVALDHNGKMTKRVEEEIG